MELLRLLLLVVEAILAPWAPAPINAPMPVASKIWNETLKQSDQAVIGAMPSDDMQKRETYRPAGRAPCAMECSSHPRLAPTIHICPIAHSRECAPSPWGAGTGDARTNQAVCGRKKARVRTITIEPSKLSPQYINTGIQTTNNGMDCHPSDTRIITSQ